jgi:hypothetical protein
MSLLLYSEHVLRGCRFMIHIERVHIGTSLKQYLRDGHGGCEVQGSLPVPATSVHHRWIDRDVFLKLFDPAQTRCRMSI